MTILHRISGSASKADLISWVRGIGIDPSIESGVFWFEIDEADPRYESVARAASASGAIDSASTTYTHEELTQADCVAFGTPAWMNGYPEPSDDFGYLNVTYDLSTYCSACGMGLIQKAPFRLKRPPKWGRRGIFILNWVLDAFFVKTETYEQLFRPAGVGYIPVVQNSSDDIIETVVQLKVEESVDLDMHDGRLLDVDLETCHACGRQRYAGWLDRGFFPRPLSSPKSPIFRSTEYIGSGAVSAHITYLSHELYEKVGDIRGVSFKACLSPFPKFVSQHT